MKWKHWIINPWEPKPKSKLGIADFTRAAKMLREADKKEKFVNWVIPANYKQVQQNNNPFKCPYAFISKLQKKGFKQLGAGFYSTVLWKTGNRVIKVQREANRDAWLDYIIWASEKGYAGSLAPKVYSYKKIGSFAVAVMEKIDYTARKIEQDDDKYMHWSMFSQSLFLKNNLADRLLDQLVPGASQFKYALREFAKNGRLDCHNDNIMFRSDGSMVIVDPVSHQSNLKGVVRLKARDFGLAPAY